MNSAARIERQRKGNLERWYKDYSGNRAVHTQPLAIHRPVHGGDIRMLCDIKERPELVLVVNRWHEEAVLIVPFSPYAFPAVELELRIGETLPVEQSVLQVWNARTIGTEFIENSRWCGRVSRGTCDEVSIMLRHHWLCEGLGDLGGALGRLGPAWHEIPDSMGKILHKYMEDEIAVFADIDAADLAKLDGYDE